MTTSARPVRIHHCTSEPYRFFGRAAELALLDGALAGGAPSVVALVGPGGQGKTAIMQHWLERLVSAPERPEGVFLWSFYRGKDSDICLRELYAYAAGLDHLPEVSASYCVDQLLTTLRRERWAIVFDGTEVVQYDTGSWQGRFLHPELGRLIEELASEPMPGVVVMTTRFELPTLTHRKHARLVALSGLDPASARGLLQSLGVHGLDVDLDNVAMAGGYHAKAVELLGTYLARYHQGDARQLAELPEAAPMAGASDEELRVTRVLVAYQQALTQEAKDVLALATAFRDPPGERRLREYLVCPTVQSLLHETWKRPYQPFGQRSATWVTEMMDELVHLRLLERVGRGTVAGEEQKVIDAHPLVRRAFEHVLGPSGQRQSAQARAGFLRGRPDRRHAETLEQAREEMEMFHAYCDAGLWNEADSAFVALDNPKHRFLAPALERDLLLRFFPDGDWRRPPLWPGFGRYRSLAICCEMLGQFEDALAVYRENDAPLGGDALIALGRLNPLLNQPYAPHPWQTLWQAYRSHALALAGRNEEAAALAQSLVPVDVYEWVHVFECLLRTGQIAALDLRSVLFRPPHSQEHRWADLARRRMRADYLRLTDPAADLNADYLELVESYDRGGLPYERALTRLGFASWLVGRKDHEQARSVNGVTLELARQHGMKIVEMDALSLATKVDPRQSDSHEAAQNQLTQQIGYRPPARP